MNPPACNEVRVEGGRRAFRRESPISPIRCELFATRSFPTARSTIKASPELSRIRREIEKQRRSIQESLRGYLRRLSEGGTVQDELVTIRGERFVIPVKVEQKRRVQGVVHGASSSGQTVFVEPLETIEQNNELVRLLDEEQAEIHRILVEMTRRIGENAAQITRRSRNAQRTRIAVCQSAFCRRVQLRPGSSSETRVGTVAHGRRSNAARLVLFKRAIHCSNAN